VVVVSKLCEGLLSLLPWFVLSCTGSALAKSAKVCGGFYVVCTSMYRVGLSKVCEGFAKARTWFVLACTGLALAKSAKGFAKVVPVHCHAVI
jgi:hypothetical protein